MRLQPGQDVDINCAAPASCDVVSGFNSYSSCQLQLPCMGTFVLKSCTADGAEVSACEEVEVGRNATSWRYQPWSGHDEWRLLMDPAATYK